MKRVAFLVAGFAYMVLLIAALHAAVAWWHDELAQPGWGDMALIAVLPLLVWVWWRYISPFGSVCQKCALPPQADRRQ